MITRGETVQEEKMAILIKGSNTAKSKRIDMKLLVLQLIFFIEK